MKRKPRENWTEARPQSYEVMLQTGFQTQWEEIKGTSGYKNEEVLRTE